MAECFNPHLLRMKSGLEVWCGATEPPTLIDADIRVTQRSLDIAVYELETDVHGHDLPQPVRTESQRVPMGFEMDAYEIGRRATQFVADISVNPEV